jgi:peptidoglycan/LPS O-acetylase OafA/YrhL
VIFSMTKWPATPPVFGEKMQSVEAARALAAFVVVLMHAANGMRVEHFSGHIGLGGIFDFGYVGVDFFFVLSGFIITHVHFGDLGVPKTMPRYLWRRFSRIYPIYWSILLLSALMAALGRFALRKPVDLDFGLADIPGTVFLLMSTGEPKLVGVAWSLQFEVVFYIAFCLFLINVRLGSIVFCTWGLVVLSRALGLISIELPFGLGSAHCLQFLMGVAIGLAGKRYRMRVFDWVLFAACLAFLGAVWFEVYGPFGRHGPQGRIALGIAAAAILATLVALENEGSIKTPSWLAWMGSVSYSIYLGHILFINLTFMVLLKTGLYHALPEALILLIGVGAALLATMWIGRYIELPLVRALKVRRLGVSSLPDQAVANR